MCLYVDVAVTRKVKENIKKFEFYKDFRYELNDDGIKFRSPYQGSRYDLPGTFYENDAFTKTEIKKIQKNEGYSLRHSCLHVYCLSKDKKIIYQEELFGYIQSHSFSCTGTITIDIAVKPQNFIAADQRALKEIEAAVTEFTVSDRALKRAIKSIKKKFLEYKKGESVKISNYDKIMKILK